jgi:peroxiredoxin
MRLPRLSANAWLLICAAVLLVALAGEPAYWAITGRKTAEQIALERQEAEEIKWAAGPAVGEPAPPLALKSYKDGRPVNLNDYRGHDVLVSFYCGCGYCIDVASQFEKLQKKHPKHRPVMLGIFSFTPDRLEPFLTSSGARSAVYLYDPNKGVGRRWGSTTCPRTWLVDAKGRIAYRHELRDGEIRPSRVPRQVWNRLEHPKPLRTAAR